MENNSDLRLLKVTGLTYNPLNPGIYGLILKEVNGDRRLPIIVGENEAHSIEYKLQEIITARPLTHDLMVNVMRALGLQLTRVVIKRLEGGVYAADLYLASGGRELVIDARSSDAIAIALRTGSPIYTSDALLDDAGMKRSINVKVTKVEEIKPAPARVDAKPKELALSLIHI